MTSATFCLPSYETSSDVGTWKMHKKNPQMTQISADKKEMRKLVRKDSSSICENLRNLRIE